MPDARKLAAILCNTLTAEELEALREDPIAAIPLVDGTVSVRLVHDEPGDGCSVEGMYHEPSGSITVQEAGSYRRTRFTTLHEFGHHRARFDPDVARYLSKWSAGAGRRLEEQIADAFAAAVLIPERAVLEVVGSGQPTAHHVVDLFHRPEVEGSREACCVQIAQHMAGEGYVILAEGDRLRFCAVVGSAYVIRRGALQSEVGLLRIAAEYGSSTDPNTKLQFPGGRFTREYAGQAVADGNYTFAVLTDSSTPPWGGWIAPRQGEGDAPEIYCGQCDEVTEAWRRCDTNSAHRVCGECGWCECRKPRATVAERICDVCTLRKRFDLFPDGGSTCRDCL